MRYGLPYKGSKNKIAEWVVSHFPDVDNLYDLFGGGGAITHCSLLNKDFKKIYYNDLEKGLTQLFKDSVNGKYKDEIEWISREDFYKRKDNLYIRYCWSFGNNGSNYLYSEEKEPLKKALHYAKVLNDFSLFKEIGIDLNINEEDKEKRKTLINNELKKNKEKYKEIYIDWYLNNCLGITKKKIEELKKLNKETLTKERDKEKKRLQKILRDALKESGLKASDVNKLTNTDMAGHWFGNSQWAFPTYEMYEIIRTKLTTLPEDYYGTINYYAVLLQSLQSLERLQSLQSLERLQRLESLEKFKTIEFLNKSYDNIEIKKNSIVYCDIPYKDTDGYNFNFNYNSFYDWCSKQEELVIVSEYNMPEDKFIEIDKIEKLSLLNNKQKISKKDQGAVKEEKLFIPKHQKDLYEKLIKKEES